MSCEVSRRRSWRYCSAPCVRPSSGLHSASGLWSGSDCLAGNFRKSEFFIPCFYWNKCITAGNRTGWGTVSEKCLHKGTFWFMLVYVLRLFSFLRFVAELSAYLHLILMVTSTYFVLMGQRGWSQLLVNPTKSSIHLLFWFQFLKIRNPIFRCTDILAHWSFDFGLLKAANGKVVMTLCTWQ